MRPIENFSWKENISQLFGVSASFYQKNFGSPGHQGVDMVVRNNQSGFGTTVYSMHAGTIESITYDVPHKTKGNGIYILSEDKTFSTNYWHLSGFEVSVGERVRAWQPIGLMGNSGRVFPVPSPACPRCGSHLHVGVKVHEKRTEYNGFIDPVPLLWREGQKLPMRFSRNLFYGCSGDDVSWLQTILRIELKDQIDFEPISYFGVKTLKAVRALQKKYHIMPDYGFFGEKTRLFANNKYAL